MGFRRGVAKVFSILHGTRPEYTKTYIYKINRYRQSFHEKFNPDYSYMGFFFLFRPSSSRSPPDHTRTQPSHKKANVKILKNFDEAIIVDAASLDPESLYQRTYAGKMTFGRVSDLGQFIRESEPEPDIKKSKGSMFSQAMKKWVQGNTDEAQEEMAWRIAKMIVNDVMQQAQPPEAAVDKVTKL